MDKLLKTLKKKEIEIDQEERKKKRSINRQNEKMTPIYIMVQKGI